MPYFKFKGKKTGGRHVRVQVFAGQDNEHLANCGELCLLPEEWRDLIEVLFEGKYTAKIPIEILTDGKVEVG